MDADQFGPETNESEPERPQLPAHILKAIPHKSPRRKPPDGPRQLTARHKLLVEYLTFGCEHAHLLANTTREQRMIDSETGEMLISQVAVKPGQPLSVDEAAKLLKLRKRNVRELLTLPIMQKALAVAAQRLRTGEHARSIHTLLEIRDDHGAGKAADRKVRMQAAQAVLGEGEGNRASMVNVNTNLGIVQRGGLVIRLPKDAPRIPLEDDDDKSLVIRGLCGSARSRSAPSSTHCWSPGEGPALAMRTARHAFKQGSTALAGSRPGAGCARVL